uniref:Synaptic plasticity regulator PANTS n=1 Tax=Xenopus tropicalis TaxID=8364 RepID=A0A803KDK1_XENTR
MSDTGGWRPPRDCDDYWSEWKHCKSLRNHFHNYYTHGKAPECQEWKRDYMTCRDWEKTKSELLKETLQQSERTRLEGKRNNSPVWTLRKNPPPDWCIILRYRRSVTGSLTF